MAQLPKCLAHHPLQPPQKLLPHLFNYPSLLTLHPLWMRIISPGFFDEYYSGC
jgi:hypothetical protein